MYNILVCDDEADIRSALRVYLSGDEYSIFEAKNGEEALEIIKKEDIHLLLMDIMMPVLDGITALAKLRENGNNIPVILLTSKSQDTDKILGLNAGADDYITKPFNPVEVIARIKSQLRRYMHFGGNNETQEKNDSAVIRNGGLELDTNAKTVTRDGETVNLTPTEMMLLKFFMENLDKVYSPKEIYRKVWKDDPFGAENTVTVHIRHLREKIEIDPAKPDYLKVVWGHGYKMEKKKPLEKLIRSDS
ncbi:MAG: response regulator transcription factor [Clostridia bacterium]|nr:response regulator transcription factor [Clostridia bacterium]